MDSSLIRKKFFDFFIAQKHEKVPSSSLIPAQDPTLLFANAGMNQFKDLFLGKEKRSYSRAVSIQKCVRAGGKHNDLDNVGFTKRHLTFFEMMGNFSFGDYFKKEAIQFAWDFLTKELQIPKDNLYASVFREDDEAYQIWHTVIGLPENRIVRLGEADNFWQMGDTGPCGPCSEIYIDRGITFGCGKKDCAPGCSCDRFLEIWNLVLMQFDRQQDGTDKPLKQTGVDTGMGLERLCSVIQNKDPVFLTDLFAPILKKTEELTGLAYDKQDDKVKAAFHVLADHIRSSALIIADGGSPSNEGRGYVLRKIIRRAALFAQKLSDKNIFPELVDPLVEKLGEFYPELVASKAKIKTILSSEIEKFSANLVRGQAILESYFAQSTKRLISGEQAFKLYDTFGFPLELIRVIAHERGFEVDLVGFEKEMAHQKEQSGKKTISAAIDVEIPDALKTEFTGYQETQNTSPVIALIHDNKLVQSVDAGDECWVITEQSPFYVECGGQISDQGTVSFDAQEAKVLDLKKFNNAIGAKISAPSALKVGDRIEQVVDATLRLNTMKNHTATHLLQAALIKIFGSHIKQSGSLVEPDYLRFDFTYHENLSAADIKKVEDMVNGVITANIPLAVTQSTQKEATDRGVIAFFGEKYNPEKVRVVEVPGFSAELCGGTHVRATGDIGCFKITEISALSAGNRRIVALTGPKAMELFQEDFAIIKGLCQDFATQPHMLVDTINKQKVLLKDLQAQIKHLKKEMMQAQLPTWISAIEIAGSIPFLSLDLPGSGVEELREIGAQLAKSKPGFYFLVSSTDEKCGFFATLSPEFAKNLDMKALQTWLQTLGLRGGGTTTLQGGGPRFDKASHGKIKQRVIENSKK